VARFLYISDRTARSNWREAPVSEHERFAWRMVAGNNRPIGRSPVAYPSLPASVAATAALRRDAELLEGTVVFDATKGEWRWIVTLAGTSVAVCVYPYARRVECARAMRQFIEAVRTAEADVSDLRQLGPSALRAYDEEPPPLRMTAR
jgi:hypothetical protein